MKKRTSILLLLMAVSLTGCVVTGCASRKPVKQVNQSDIDEVTDSLLRGVGRLAAERDYWKAQALKGQGQDQQPLTLEIKPTL